MPDFSNDSHSLTAAISRGIVDGNAQLIQVFTSTSERRHEVRNQLQAISDRVWEHDKEMASFRSTMVTLVGSGDGSSGMVSALQRDVKGLGTEVGRLTSAVTEMSGQVCKLNSGHDEQRSWTDGWKGVGVAISLISTCLTLAGSLVAGVVYVFTHGHKV